MSSLLVIALVAIAVGAVGDGFRGARRILASMLRPAQTRRGSRSTDTAQRTRVIAIVLVVLGAVGALGALVGQNLGAAMFAAIMLGIGLPILVVGIYRGIGIEQPPLYAWILIVGIVVSPFGLLAWYGAVIAAEIIVAGLLLLWCDRKDKIIDTYEHADTAQVRYSRLRRTAIILIGLACTVVLTAISARWVWLWLIVAGVAAAYYMVRKFKAMRAAKAEAQAARDAEVERILNTRVPGLDPDDEELLQRYTQDVQSAAAAAALRKGERMEMDADEVTVHLTGASTSADVDCYVFCLDGRGKARRDEDLVFFGQPASPDGAVTIDGGSAGPGADINLTRVPNSTDRIEVVFGLSADAPAQATWVGGTVTVRVGNSAYSYPVDADGKTRTVDVLRLYRHRQGWKMWITDHRSIQGISALCSEYGVDVA